MSEKISPQESAYIWDYLVPQVARITGVVLELLKARELDRPHLANACHYFFVRTDRRHLAMEVLLPRGLYPEAMTIVRAAFEDWVNASYIFQDSTDARWASYLDDTNITDARILRELGRYGILDLDEYRSALNDAERKILVPHLEKRRKPWNSTTLETRARAVGLQKAYDLAYPLLCEYSHGGSRMYWEGIEQGNIHPKREPRHEVLPVTWFLWFHLRTLGLCVRPYGGRADHSAGLITYLKRAGVYWAYPSAVLEAEEVYPPEE